MELAFAIGFLALRLGFELVVAVAGPETAFRCFARRPLALKPAPYQTTLTPLPRLEHVRRVRLKASIVDTHRFERGSVHPTTSGRVIHLQHAQSNARPRFLAQHDAD